MISRSTLIGALVVAELAIVGIGIRSLTGGSGPSVAAANPHGDAGALRGTYPAGITPHVTIDLDDVRVIVQSGSDGVVNASETRHTVGWSSGAVAPIVAERTADGVRFSIPDRGGMHFVFGGWDRTLTVTVPRDTALQVTTGDGSVTAGGLRKGIIARTGDGSVHLNDVHGDVDVHTGDGGVHLYRIGGGRLDVQTGDGSISADAVRMVDGRLQTGDGRVRVAFAPDSDAVVHLHSGGGRISVDGAQTDTSDIRDDGTSRVVHLGAGSGSFDISTGDGSILLTQGGKV